jgi:hypothetical protein
MRPSSGPSTAWTLGSGPPPSGGGDGGAAPSYSALAMFMQLWQQCGYAPGATRHQASPRRRPPPASGGPAAPPVALTWVDIPAGLAAGTNGTLFLASLRCAAPAASPPRPCAPRERSSPADAP